ncbi:MAG: hypothetical protein AB7O24_19560 [Kofleriaceae bacterium]
MRLEGVVAWLAAALALPGCGFKRPADVPDDGDVVDANTAIAECEPASGSQIKVVMRQHTDGSRQFVRLIDANTGRACRFVSAGDGKSRCMPYSDEYSDGFVAYSNSSCSTPILGIYTNRFYPDQLFVGNDGAETSGFPGVGPGTSGCVPSRRVFAVGNPLADPAEIYLRDGLGGCVAQTPDTFLYDFYTAGAEVPATNFVEGVPTRIGSGRIQLEVTDGTDGSRFCGDSFSVFRDTTLDVTCAPNVTYDDVPRCLPTNTYSGGIYYTDAACSQQQAAGIRAACRSESPYVSEFATSQCGNSVVRIRQAGSALGSVFYRDAMNVCQAMPTGSSGYAVGDYVDDSQFAAMNAEWVPAGSRLERIDALLDGARFPIGIWRDTLLQTDCAFNSYVTDRCAPLSTLEQPVANAWGFKLYAAGNCPETSVVDYAVVDKFIVSACAEPQGAPRFAMKEDPDRGFEFYRVGNVVPGTFYIKYSGGSTCDQLPATSTVYEIGAGVTDELVSGTEVQL